MSPKTDEEKWPRPPFRYANHVFDFKENVSTLGSPLTLLVLGWPDSEWLLTTKSPRLTCTMRWLSSRQEPNFAPLIHYLFFCIHSFKTKNPSLFWKINVGVDGVLWNCQMAKPDVSRMLVAVKGLEETGGLSIWKRVDSYLSIGSPSPPLPLLLFKFMHTMDEHYIHASVQKWLKPIPPVFHHKCFV
jgi:hypothetical protein